MFGYDAVADLKAVFARPMPVPDSVLAKGMRKGTKVAQKRWQDCGPTRFKLNDYDPDYTIEFFRKTVASQENSVQLDYFCHCLATPLNFGVTLDCPAAMVVSRTFSCWPDPQSNELTFVIGGIANDYICNLGLLWKLVNRGYNVVAPSYYNAYGSLMTKAASDFFNSDWQHGGFTREGAYFLLVLEKVLIKYPQVEKINLVAFSTGCPVTLNFLEQRLFTGATFTNQQLQRVVLLSPTAVINRWRQWWPLETFSLPNPRLVENVAAALPQTNGYWQHRPSWCYRWRRSRLFWQDLLKNLLPDPVYQEWFEILVGCYQQTTFQVVTGGRDYVTNSGIDESFQQLLKEIQLNHSNFQNWFYPEFGHGGPISQAEQVLDDLDW